MDWPWSVWQRELGAIRGPGIRMLTTVPGCDIRDDFSAFGRLAASQGYVAVDALADVSDAARRRLWHRHVLLVHRGTATPMSLRWIRELAAASPRAHAVVAIEDADRACEGSMAFDRQLDPLPPEPADPVARRARRLRRRQRTAAARRWSRAAVERSCRADDPIGAARAFTDLCALAESQPGLYSGGVTAQGKRLLASLDDVAARSHVAAALAGAWIAHGEFEAATSALAAIAAECALLHAEVPSWIRERQAEIACWLGCWEEADRCGRQAGHPGWRGVASLARRDWATVRELWSAATEQPAWRPLLTMVARAVDDDRSGVIRCLDEVRGTEGPPRWRDVLVLESFRMTGAQEEWQRWFRAGVSRRRAHAEDVLWRWITRDAAPASSNGRERPADGVRRLGAPGVFRWGLERQTMQTWAGVLSLLRHVQEADDPLSALRQGCGWARAHTGVDAVAVTIADGTGVVVACDPPDYHRPLRGGSHTAPDAPPPDAAITEPVRYGGTRIGSVLVLGPGRDEPECRAVASALATACAPALRARLDDLRVAGAGEALAGELIGISPAMRALRASVARAAGSDFPVLIEGESGTGKELVARALHRLGARRDRRWTAVNCAALTDELLEAELFGHTRGAFTGAMGSRVGLLEDAHEGTLFLDEIAELSPRAQAKLLRVLQEGEIRRVGENASRRVDVRLIAATNRPLADICRQGAYREDLLFRLAVIRLRVPPLRDRIEDVPLLAQAFWRAAAARSSTHAMLAPDAVAALCRPPWPGNVRELQNIIAAIAVGGPTRGRISARHVAEVLASHAGAVPDTATVSLAEARARCDRSVIVAALARHAGNRAAAARELGVSRQALGNLIARLGVPPVSAT